MVLSASLVLYFMILYDVPLSYQSMMIRFGAVMKAVMIRTYLEWFCDVLLLLLYNGLSLSMCCFL